MDQIAPTLADRRARILSDEVREGARVLRLGGRLTVANVAGLDRVMQGIAPERRPLVVDLAAVERVDTIGAWLVHRLMRDWSAAGGESRVVNASEGAAQLIDRVARADMPTRVHGERERSLTRQLGRVGGATIDAIATLGGFLDFLGVTLVTLGKAVFRPKRWRVNAVVHQIEAVTVNALAIVGLMSFLVGIVIAQQGAVQLRQFGAEVFTINLVGRATLRELGVLMTAIMVAGRSGAAFAAQIGSMKLAEEVDALRTIGMSPYEVLVLPRLLALVLTMPLLSFFAAICALVGGGLFTSIELGIPIATFIQRTQEIVPMTDFWITCIKAPLFGVVIAITGCFQGMQVVGNAESVGQRTTAAVVQSIFLVIVLDAFLAVFFTMLGWI